MSGLKSINNVVYMSYHGYYIFLAQHCFKKVISVFIQSLSKGHSHLTSTLRERGLRNLKILQLKGFDKLGEKCGQGGRGSKKIQKIVCKSYVNGL